MDEVRLATAKSFWTAYTFQTENIFDFSWQWIIL